MIQRVSPFESAWNPFTEVEEFRRTMNRIFGTPNGAGGTFPPLNIYANEEEAVVSAEVPGIDKEALDISVDGSTFTLTGSREPAAAGEEATYVRQERFGGRFHRVVELPFNVEAGSVKAHLRNGILVVHLPRAESDKPRKITIENQ